MENNKKYTCADTQSVTRLKLNWSTFVLTLAVGVGIFRSHVSSGDTYTHTCTQHTHTIPKRMRDWASRAAYKVVFVYSLCLMPPLTFHSLSMFGSTTFCLVRSLARSSVVFVAQCADCIRAMNRTYIFYALNVQNGDRYSFASTSVCVLAKLCCTSPKNSCI